MAALMILRQLRRKHDAECGKMVLSGVKIEKDMKEVDHSEHLTDLLYIRQVLKLAMASGGWLSGFVDQRLFTAKWGLERYK